MIDNIEGYKKTLLEKGFVVLSPEDLPWNLEELLSIKKMTDEDQIPYKHASYGDTKESASATYFRLRHPTINETSLPQCMEIIEKNEAKDFFKKLTDLPSILIDRCQVHIYKKDDFLAKHVDSESQPAYRFTVIFLLSDDYDGGEFVI